MFVYTLTDIIGGILTGLFLVVWGLAWIFMKLDQMKNRKNKP